MSEYLPMHERRRRASVKRYIHALEKYCRTMDRWFKAAVKDEPVGSPRYDAFWREAQDHRRQVTAEIRRAKMELPPHLIWRNDLGCHEIMLVELGRRAS